MIKHIFLKFFVLTLVHFSIVHGVVSYSLQQYENGHCILNLGDYHREEMDEENGRHSLELVELIKKYANQSQPLKIYLEGSDKALKTPEVEIARSIKVMQEGLAKLKEKEKVDYALYEPRKSESDFVNSYFLLFNDAVYNNVGLDEKKFLDFFKCFMVDNKDCSLSLGTYLKTLYRDEQRLRKWRDEYPKSSLENNLLNENYLLFVKSKEMIVEEFSRKDSNKLLINAFIEFIAQEGHGNIARRLKLLATLVLENSDYVVANAGFLRKFLKEDKYKNLIFFTGEHHQRYLSEVIERLGYRIIISDNTLVRDNNTCSIVITPEFLSNISYCVRYCTALSKDQHEFKKNKLSLLQEQKAKSLNAITNVRMCDYCKKIEENRNFQCCSKCKKVLYCNRSCQRAAWAEHKKICK